MQKIKSNALAMILIAGVLAMSGVQSQAGPFTFTKIADESETAPGSPFKYSSFQNPYIDGGKIAFVARAGNTTNVYSDIGGSSIAFLANSGNQIDISGGKVAFIDSAGIKTTSGGAATLVVDATDTFPGTGVVPGSTGLGRMAFGGGSVVYSGNGVGSSIFSNRSGTPEAVATTGFIPRPAYSVRFGSLSGPDIDGDDVVFTGTGSAFVDDGVYIDNGTTLTAVATKGDVAPGGNGTFKSFGRPVIDNGDVAFVGTSSGVFPGNLDGLYKKVGGVLSVVADENAIAPGKVDTFAEFLGESFSLDNGNVVFMGDTNPLFGERGIYTDIGGSLQKVIDLDDILEPGRDVTGLFIGPNALDGNLIVFRVNFFDGNDAIYLAEFTGGTPVAEPASWLVLVLGCAGLMRLRLVRT